MCDALESPPEAVFDSFTDKHESGHAIPLRTCSGEDCVNQDMDRGMVKVYIPEQRLVLLYLLQNEEELQVYNESIRETEIEEDDEEVRSTILRLTKEEEALFGRDPFLPAVDDSFTQTFSEQDLSHSTRDPQICEENNPAWGHTLVTFQQGPAWNGSIAPTRSDPFATLGVTTPQNNTYPEGSFYALGKGGSITISFLYPLHIRPGVSDLDIYEVTNDRAISPIDRARVEISATGDPGSWVSAGEITSVQYPNQVDLSSTGLSTFQYVRITDTTRDSDVPAGAFGDGFDLDAIEAAAQRCTQHNIGACMREEAEWVSRVLYHDQGTMRNGEPILPNISNPNTTIGPNDSFANTIDRTLHTGFYSLGYRGPPYNVSITVLPPDQSSSLIVGFDEPIANIPGEDILFYEVTAVRGGYPEERALIELSQDGATWHRVVGDYVTNLDPNGVSGIDISDASPGLEWIRYARLIDQTDWSGLNGEGDGYDLDAAYGYAIYDVACPGYQIYPTPTMVLTPPVSPPPTSSSTTTTSNSEETNDDENNNDTKENDEAMDQSQLPRTGAHTTWVGLAYILFITGILSVRYGVFQKTRTIYLYSEKRSISL